MSQIQVRNPLGNEYSFGSVEEFNLAIQTGGVTAEWEVYHSRGSRWLPVTHHPVFLGRVSLRRVE